jgi:hypothetical protein
MTPSRTTPLIAALTKTDWSPIGWMSSAGGVELLDRDGAAVQLDVVFELADLFGPGRDDQVLGVHGVDDIVGGDAMFLQQALIEIDLDLALLAAVGKRDRGAGDTGKLGAHEVVGEIEKPLLRDRPA